MSARVLDGVDQRLRQLWRRLGLAGRPFPREQVRVFCTRLTRIHDEAVVEVLEPILNQLAEEQRCPHHDTGAAFPDSYRAVDSYSSS